MCTLPVEQPKLEPYPKIPLFEYIEKESREWVTDAEPGKKQSSSFNRGRSSNIVVFHTRAFKWYLNGRFSGAWVKSVDDETDFDKLATALYVARRIRRSKFWAWWYKTFYSVKSYFVDQGASGNEWPENLS